MAIAGTVTAADPSPIPGATPAPVPQRPTCAERYPADGPAGVDLLLGCVVSELVRYAGGLGGGLEPVGEPPRLSGYLVPIGILVATIVSIALVVRVARRDAGRRLAPAAPVAWWSCAACRSLNAAGRTACYRCGREFEEGATELRADGEPLAPQSFGIRRDR
ncbi:MAG TPA: zinc finger Ran-binding domain-containing protein [Candidatus Sulfomarinibacteraceae bacterium]|nr:zinc finger Ran-binding domain-containing protein [Candidatus Sulfomarinibacteraceae bacterium]